MKLYGQITSGNCWKIRLALSLLGQDYTYQSLDTINGETREDWYRAINPAAKIPCLVLSNGEAIIESGAILWRLLKDSPYWPTDISAQTRVLSWMFWEQYSHEPTVAVARSWKKYHGKDKTDPEAFQTLQTKANEALALMEMQLTYTPWLATDHPTIADIALYPYTALAPDADLNLTQYPNTQAWLKCVEALKGYHPITVSG